MSKTALGRGLGALLSGVATNVKAATPPSVAALAPEPDAGPHAQVRRVALERIRPCPLQPRKDFSPAALQELADSIKEQGVIQPLIVRERADHFELIAGERRWRAAQMSGLKDLPVIVRDADDTAVLELALIENLQRENLNPLEEALGYAQLIEQFHLRQEDVATKVGKSRALVANALRLLKLPAELQNHVRVGRLSVGHAKVLLGLSAPEQQKRAAERVLKHGLNVRQTEQLVAQWQNQPRSGAKVSAPTPSLGRDAHVADLENRLRERFGAKVQLRYREGKGSVEIQFFNDADLERILHIAGVKMD